MVSTKEQDIGLQNSQTGARTPRRSVSSQEKSVEDAPVMPLKSDLDASPYVSRQTKFLDLRARLTDLAHKCGPGAKLPTVVQLRDSLGVSLATLTSALSDLEAQNIIVRRHGVGIYVSSTLHQKAICLICDPSFMRGAGTSPFWGMLIERARERAVSGNEAFSFHLSIPDGHSDAPLHDGLVNEIAAGRVHGILSIGLSDEVSRWIDGHHIPYVSFAARGRWTVSLDAGEVVRRGVEQLAQQGCRAIGFWRPVAPFRYTPSDGKPDKDTQTFIRVLEKHGLPYHPEFVKDNHHLLVDNLTTQTHQEQGYRTALKTFGSRRKPAPDGILIGDDMMTLGSLIALKKLGVQVIKGEIAATKTGKNEAAGVRIATHANKDSTVLLGHEDELTRIEQDPAEVVQAMFDMLETLMDGLTPAQQEVRILPRLVP